MTGSPRNIQADVQVSVRWRRGRVALALALVSIPIAVAAFYVFSYAVDVPYYDQWEQVPYIEKYLTGQLSLSSLFARHEGHIAFLERLFTIVSVSLFHWSSLFEIWIGFAFLVATVVLISADILAADDRQHLAVRLLQVSAVSAVLFSLRQWENLLAPWAFGFFGSTLFVVTACYFAAKPGARSFVLSLSAAALATVTFTNGLLVWVLVPAQRLLQRRSSPSGSPDLGTGNRWGLDGVWVALGCAAWSAFLFAGKAPFAHSGQGTVASTVLKRFAAGLGLALTHDKAVIAGGAFPMIILPIDITVCVAVGLLLVLLAGSSVYLLWRSGRIASSAFAVSLTAFGAGSIAMVAAGRANLGVQQILSSRYASASSLFVAGTFILAERATRDRPVRSWVIPVLATLIVVSNTIATLTEMHVGPFRRDNFAGWATTIRAFRTATDEQLQNPHFPPGVIRAHCTVLERHHLSVFSRPLPPKALAAEPPTPAPR